MMKHIVDMATQTKNALEGALAHMEDAFTKQEGGSHYKEMKIQPLEYILANNLGYLEGNVIKYVSRHKTKGKAEDIKKAIHYLQFILAKEYDDDAEPK